MSLYQTRTTARRISRAERRRQKAAGWTEPSEERMKEIRETQARISKQQADKAAAAYAGRANIRSLAKKLRPSYFLGPRLTYQVPNAEGSEVTTHFLKRKIILNDNKDTTRARREKLREEASS